MPPHRQQPTRLPRPWDSPGKNTGVGCHCLLQCMKVKRESEVTQSCLTLSNPMDCSLPGSSVHGIFQARVLEWGAIAFSKDFHAINSKYTLKCVASWAKLTLITKHVWQAGLPLLSIEVSQVHCITWLHGQSYTQAGQVGACDLLSQFGECCEIQQTWTGSAFAGTGLSLDCWT